MFWMNPTSQFATGAPEGAVTRAFHVNFAESTSRSVACEVKTAFGPEVPAMEAATVNAGT
jgi:hypothetical protein